MKQVYITIITSLILLFNSLSIFSQSATVTVFYTGFQACGGCTVCGSDYWCINTNPSYCGATAACETRTFFDPIPAGYVATSVTVNYYSAGCAGSYIDGSINGFSVPTVNDANTGCWCDDNPCAMAASSSNNYPCGMPGYVYGGSNSLQLCTGIDVCINKVELVFSYVLPDVITPSISANGPLSFCQGGSVGLNAGAGYLAYYWSTGSTAQTITASTSGTYTVTVTSVTGCTTGTSSATVTVNPLPTVNAGVDQTVCAGTAVTLSGSGATSYTWNNGVTNGTQFTPAVGTVTYTVTGTDGNSCSNTDQVIVTVNALPTANAGSDVVICNGSNTQLGATGGTAYSWSPSGGLSATNISNPVANPAITTTYTVTVTDGYGCTDTDNITVYVLAMPVANAGQDQAICLGEPVTLTATGGGSYLWNTGDTTAIISYTPSVTTVYIVTVSYTNGCSSSDDVFVTVNSIPTVSLTSDPDIYANQGQIVTYTAVPAGYDNYNFYVDNVLVQSGSSNIYITNTLQNNQVVLVVANEAGCGSEPDSLSLDIKLIPNAFTPYNVDGINDVFVKGLDIKIINRWGQLLYEGKDGWDGKYNEQYVSKGTYYFVIKYIDINGSASELKGAVSVVN